MSLYLFDMACLLRAVAEQQQQQRGQQEGGAGAIAVSKARDAASKALEVLSHADVADPMRRKYLAHRRDEVRELMRALDGMVEA